MRCKYLVLGVNVFLAGCTAFSPEDIGRPTELSLQDAMADAGVGFARMKQELRRADVKLGLYPCKFTVNFNVTASAAQGGKLVLDASADPTSVAQSTSSRTLTASANFEQVNSSSATRGNTVVVEMYSIACTPAETLASKHPDKVGEVTRRANEGVLDSPLMVPQPSR